MEKVEKKGNRKGKERGTGRGTGRGKNNESNGYNKNKERKNEGSMQKQDKKPLNRKEEISNNNIINNFNPEDKSYLSATLAKNDINLLDHVKHDSMWPEIDGKIEYKINEKLMEYLSYIYQTGQDTNPEFNLYNYDKIINKKLSE